MELTQGTLLQGGRYKIVRFISAGGFGCTYEAEHVMLHKRVAIKEFFVKDFCNRDESTLQITVGITAKVPLVKKLKKKFVEEAQSLCSLDHPNIVHVFDVFEENGTAYYVMDYIDGPSLNDLVKKNGSMSEAKALGYIKQVADALQYVHSQNRLHLDIKPGNIMVDEKDRAILIDFGASKQYDEEAGENTSTLLGKTPGYAPLEQMGNDVVKFLPSTDIYALGATLYKLLTGITPPSASLLASGETLEIPTSLSASIRNAILQSMQINKMKRPQSIDEFIKLFAPTKEESTIVDEEDDDKTFVDNDASHTGASAWQEEEARRQKEFLEKIGRETKENNEVSKTLQDSPKRARLSKLYILCIVALLVISGCYVLFTNTNKNESQGNTIVSDLDSLAYSYGVKFGDQYSNFQDKGSVIPGISLNINDFLDGFIPAIRRDKSKMPLDTVNAKNYITNFNKKLREEVNKNKSYQAQIEDFPEFEFTKVAKAYGVMFGAQYSNFADPGVVVPDPNVSMKLNLFIEGFTYAIKRDYNHLYLSIDEANSYIDQFTAHIQQEIEANKESEIHINKNKGAEYQAHNAGQDGVRTCESGLQIKTVRQGYGKQPKDGNKVLVNYVGTLIDGTQFDTNENIEFNVNNVVKGFKEGLLLMKEGEKAILTMPSDLAYGDKGVGQEIPGGSTLIFEVELLRVTR